MNKEKLYVITGGPGTGKTTLIKKLNNYRFQTVEEDARKIIKKQGETNDEGLPWKNKALYAKLMFEASLQSYNETVVKKSSNITFFDRGIIDSICYMKMENIPISTKIIELTKQHSYNRNVFILPPGKKFTSPTVRENKTGRRLNLRFKQ